MALVSGGGSGHEPLHGGFVGAGMLDAAAPGAVFTSPTPDQVLDATKAVDGGAGVLHIVKNYTGDVLNFETAAELADAEGIQVRAVVIDDDVAVKDSTWTAGQARRRRHRAGGEDRRRGGGPRRRPGRGGRRSRSGSTPRSGRWAWRSRRAPFRIPASRRSRWPTTRWRSGIGIHGEPGRERVKLARADEIVATLLGSVVEDLPFSSGDNTLLFVNGMGGTPQIELYLAYHSARKYLAEQGDRGDPLAGRATTSPRWRCRACRSPCSSWTTR